MQPTLTNNHKQVAAWALYDWANSGYSTLSITVLVTYLQNFVFAENEWGSAGAIVWAWGVAFTMLLGAVLSPFLGAIADAHANKRLWLGGTALCGATAGVLLALVPVEDVSLFVTLFLIANLCFEVSLTFYNGFLPELVGEERYNQVSSWGYGLGYVGGGIALSIVLLLFVFGPSIGISDRATQLRWGLVVMGLWWGLFTLPAIFLLRDSQVKSHQPVSLRGTATHSFNEVLSTVRNIRSYKMLALFLLAFLCYNDGIQTVLSQSSTFALKELNFGEDELVKLILMIQFAALPGALLVGWLADRYGQKRMLLLCLAIWIILLMLAYLVTSKGMFWLLGGAVAMVMGGTQSISRAIMGAMTPKEKSAQFFGFFNLSGKATGFFGAFLFGLIYATTDSARWAIVSLVMFFVVGAVLVWSVDVEQGRRAKQDDI